MDLERIKQILTSEDEISVHYHGIPIWIESFDDSSSMAVISARGIHEERQLVSIDELSE